jgi:hypothetical protein
MPDKLDSESLLMLDIVQTEHQRDEWISIAEAYRVMSEQLIEGLARLTEQNRQMKALIVNMGAELTLRKQQ